MKKRSILRRVTAVCTGLMMLAGMPVSADTGQRAADAFSTEIGLAANLYTVAGSGYADHAALQWATTLDAGQFTLYRSASSDSNFVPVYTGTGTSWSDNDMQPGTEYFYQLAVTGKGGTQYSSVKSLTPCAIPAGLDSYDNQKGSSLQYETGGYKVGNTYYSYALRSHGNGDIYLEETTSSDGRRFGNARNAADSSQNSALASCKIESVHIEYLAHANKVVVWAHWEQPSGYADGKALVITGTPGGTFTVHHVYNPLGIQVRDMAIFFDDDAAHTGYLIAAANKEGQGANATIYIFRMTADYSDVTEVVKTLHENQYREFPNMIKRNGYYFLFTSQAAGWYPSSGAYTVTDNIAGEWSGLRSIGNTSTFSSQSGWIVNLQDRNYLMHAYRWLRASSTSGTTLCPLYFDNSFAFMTTARPSFTAQKRVTSIPCRRASCSRRTSLHLPRLRQRRRPPRRRQWTAPINPRSRRSAITKSGPSICKLIWSRSARSRISRPRGISVRALRAITPTQWRAARTASHGKRCSITPTRTATSSTAPTASTATCLQVRHAMCG